MMHLSAFLLVVSYLSVAISRSGADADAAANKQEKKRAIEDARYTAGRDALTAWSNESMQPRYGACWTAALAELSAGCKALSEDSQHRMALR